MKFTRWIACLVVFASLTALRPVLSADTLKIGYSDWPGYTAFEIANQKGWFKDAGVDVQLVWFDYGPSIDAFAAGKIDADCIVASDAMGAGATGAASKFIAIIDYSEGSDMIIGKPGINSIKDLKGQKVAVELGLVEHFLLLEGLKRAGLSQSDVTLVNTPTNNMPQTLASGQVAAVGPVGVGSGGDRPPGRADLLVAQVGPGRQPERRKRVRVHRAPPGPKASSRLAGPCGQVGGTGSGSRRGSGTWTSGPAAGAGSSVRGDALGRATCTNVAPPPWM